MKKRGKACKQKQTYPNDITGFSVNQSKMKFSLEKKKKKEKKK